MHKHDAPDKAKRRPGSLTRNIANMVIQYKVGDAPEFIPTVAWSGYHDLPKSSSIRSISSSPK